MLSVMEQNAVTSGRSTHCKDAPFSLELCTSSICFTRGKIIKLKLLDVCCAVLGLDR